MRIFAALGMTGLLGLLSSGSEAAGLPLAQGSAGEPLERANDSRRAGLASTSARS
jgi:hypothetical protein